MNADKFVDTSHGRIAYQISSGSGLAVLMIHGNSTCGDVFRNQLQGAIGDAYHCIAMDLPGHGRSGDAIDPDRTYNMGGYADAAAELMRGIGIDCYAVLGWSLGGHIALDLIEADPAVCGVMIAGSPPVGQEKGSIDEGFAPGIEKGMAATRLLTDQEIHDFAHGTCGANAAYDPFLEAAVRRCDGRSRALMVAKLACGIGRNQREIAVNSRVPLAIVDGAEDPFLNHGYIAGLPYRNLWEGKVYELDGLDHAPFWEAPDRFDPYLDRFLKSLG